MVKKYLFLLFSLILLTNQQLLSMEKLITVGDDDEIKLDMCTPGMVCCPVGCIAKGFGGCCTVSPCGICMYYFPATLCYIPFICWPGLCCIDKDGDLEDHICYFGADDCLNGGFLKNGCKFFSKVLLGAKNVAEYQLNGIKQQMINACELDDDYALRQAQDDRGCCQVCGQGMVKVCCLPASVVKKLLADCADMDEPLRQAQDDRGCGEIMEESCKKCFCCVPVALVACLKSCWDKCFGSKQGGNNDVDDAQVQQEEQKVSTAQIERFKKIIHENMRRTKDTNSDLPRISVEYTRDAQKEEEEKDVKPDGDRITNMFNMVMGMPPISGIERVSHDVSESSSDESQEGIKIDTITGDNSDASSKESHESDESSDAEISNTRNSAGQDVGTAGNTDADQQDQVGSGISSYFNFGALTDNEHVNDLKQKASNMFAGVRSLFWGNDQEDVV